MTDREKWVMDSFGFLEDHIRRITAPRRRGQVSKRVFLLFSFSANVRHSRRPSVCLYCLSVTFVHPTNAIEIFANVSTPFGIGLRWPSVDIQSGEVNTRGVAEYSDFGPIERSRKRCKIGAKLVLITNRKSHMSFRLVPKSVTLNDLERHNGHYITTIALFH